MEQSPDFFLSTAGEYEPLAEPRACWALARLQDPIRNDHMLIRIEPPLSGQEFNLGNMEIRQLVISARHQGYTLYPISEWPSFVYVARILDDAILQTLSFTRGQIEPVAWGLIFPTLQAALTHARKFNNDVVV